MAEVAGRFPFPIEAAVSAEHAVSEADIVVTATTSREPVLAREWIAPGAHVNAVGASQPTHRELDTTTVADSLLFTDRRESLENEAAEYRLALQEGRISGTHLRAEIGELLTGEKHGRVSAHDLTLFRSLGLAVCDVAAAEYVTARALESGAGTAVQW